MADYRKQWQEYRKLRSLALALVVSVFASLLVGVTFRESIASSLTWTTVSILIGAVLLSIAIVTAMRWKIGGVRAVANDSSPNG